MKNLIYDFYGIYIESMNGNYFVYEGVHYYCLDCKLDETSLVKHFQLYEQSFIASGGTHYLQLVKNRYNRYLSSDKVLLCIEDNQVFLVELIRQSLMANGSGHYDEITKAWIKEMDMIENRILPAIMGESRQFEYLYALTIYYLGMAESALAYLQDYFNKEMTYQKSLCLTNRYLENNLDWLNPFCYRTSHHLDFLVRMYYHSYITIDQVSDHMSNLAPIDLVYMFSTMLYPHDFFEDVILYVQDQIDEKAFLKYYQQIEINEKRLKDFFEVIVQTTQLRPLEWL